MLRVALADARTHLTLRASFALRALISAYDSDVQGAIALLRRGLTVAPARDDEAAYLRDLLAMYLVSTGEFSAYEQVVREQTNPPARLVPATASLQSVAHAVAGDAAASRTVAHAAMSGARAMDDPLVLGRVLSRCALAAYYRHDYDAAHDLAIEGVHVFEMAGAYAAASTSYSVAAAVAQSWNRDGVLALEYYTQMLRNAERGGHNALRRSALAACFGAAAEMYDVEKHAAFRKRLMSRPEREHYQEKFVLVIGDALGYGWNREFAAAESALTACLAGGKMPAAETALVEALLALVAAARWDVARARNHSRAALKRTAEHCEGEPLHDRHFRELARVLAAAACFIIGDQVRGQRALSARFDAGHQYRELLNGGTIDIDRCPVLFRGYAQFANVALECAREARPKYNLTAAELAILRALPHGATLGELALELEKSKSTVGKQVESIYQKLNARNRAQAIQHAREYGII